MTWSQGDPKTKNLLLSEAKLRCCLTVVKATAKFCFAGGCCFSIFARLEFFLHLLARCPLPVARASANR